MSEKIKPNETIIDYLISCSPSEFSKLISKVLEARNATHHLHPINEIEEKLVFCSANRYVGSYDGVENDWNFEVIAPGNPEAEWRAFETQSYWEQGECKSCKVELTSYAKSVLCPLCGSPVGLT